MGMGIVEYSCSFIPSVAGGEGLCRIAEIDPVLCQPVIASLPNQSYLGIVLSKKKSSKVDAILKMPALTDVSK